MFSKTKQIYLARLNEYIFINSQVYIFRIQHLSHANKCTKQHCMKMCSNI